MRQSSGFPSLPGRCSSFPCWGNSSQAGQSGSQVTRSGRQHPRCSVRQRALQASQADMCMKFYDNSKPLYLETDVSGIGLGAALLQLCDNTVCQKGIAPPNVALHPIAFASKSLTGAEQRYSNIKWQVLRILHG